ncbi:MAG: DUF2799 domain-containing protein [Leucothrix sp.]
MTKLTRTSPIYPTSSMILLLLAVSTIFFLSSCSTLKKSDCLEGNWSGIGFNDATAGLKSDAQLSAHTKACSKHKVAPNQAVYKAGYQKGLVQFCTARNGYNRGVDKAEYYGTCPKASQIEFLKGYLAGLDTATVELNDDITDLKHQRRKAFRRYLRHKHHSKPDTKKIKEWDERVDNLESNLDSRRHERRKIRRWYDFWATKLP